MTLTEALVAVATCVVTMAAPVEVFEAVAVMVVSTIPPRVTLMTVSPVAPTTTTGLLSTCWTT